MQPLKFAYGHARIHVADLICIHCCGHGCVYHSQDSMPHFWPHHSGAVQQGDDFRPQQLDGNLGGGAAAGDADVLQKDFQQILIALHRHRQDIIVQDCLVTSLSTAILDVTITGPGGTDPCKVCCTSFELEVAVNTCVASLAWSCCLWHCNQA